MMSQPVSVPYVLVTPARNEAAFIERTIQSMIQQTVLPLKWVIVNDGSTDRTGEIVKRYLADYPWIELVENPPRQERNFSKKVGSFNRGFERVAGLPFEIIGNVDADISFDKDHFEFLLNKFGNDQRLGVAGTVFREEGGYSSETDSFEGHTHVSGQCQLFRKQCFVEIGGYVPHHAGGIDWIAVVTARMRGWKTQSFREKSFFHHRHLGTAERGPLASSFSYGEKDYYMGGHPLWEMCRVVYRMTKKPYVISGGALGAGYVWAWFVRTPRAVSAEFVRFHRAEQMSKLRIILRSIITFKKLDSFHITSS
ncbi:MAG TPA: glycosyltransferase family 2 protein [Nitrospira sp.]|nr:glycosyltransferase family 2 protein [Nitrospira sp.]